MSTPFDPAMTLSPDRLPAHSFIAACGCGRPTCQMRRVEAELLDPPEAVLSAVGTTARSTRSYLIDVADDPHSYFVIAGDRVEAGRHVERVMLVKILPYGLPLPWNGHLDPALITAVTRPFFNHGDEIYVEGTEVGAARITGPASVLQRPVVEVNVTTAPMPDGFQA